MERIWFSSSNSGAYACAVVARRKRDALWMHLGVKIVGKNFFHKSIMERMFFASSYIQQILGFVINPSCTLAPMCITTSGECDPQITAGNKHTRTHLFWGNVAVYDCHAKEEGVIQLPFRREPYPLSAQAALELEDVKDMQWKERIRNQSAGRNLSITNNALKEILAVSPRMSEERRRDTRNQTSFPFLWGIGE